MGQAMLLNKGAYFVSPYFYSKEYDSSNFNIQTVENWVELNPNRNYIVLCYCEYDITDETPVWSKDDGVYYVFNNRVDVVIAIITNNIITIAWTNNFSNTSLIQPSYFDNGISFFNFDFGWDSEKFPIKKSYIKILSLDGNQQSLYSEE